MFSDTYRCGPVEITVCTPTAELREFIASSLALYSAPWNEVTAEVRVSVEETSCRPKTAIGNYLLSQRINVDSGADGLTASSPSGTFAQYTRNHHRWTITRSAGPLDLWGATDVDYVLSLIVTTAWRETGWVPIHAGAVVRDKTCALICATSGGGKSTFSVALIRRGYKTLGDDKLLLRMSPGGSPTLRALAESFSLSPISRKWFPEVREIEKFPKSSVWVDKRRVRIEDIWPASMQSQATPTHLIQIVRNEDRAGFTVTPLSVSAVLDTLLHQTVVPTHRETALHILETISSTATALTGWRVELGDEVYETPDLIQDLEQRLR